MSQALRSDYETRVAGEVRGGSQVSSLQKKFGAPDGLPVYIKAKGDPRIYRGLVGVCGVGLAITFTSLYMMANGKMPVKPRPS